MSGLKRTASEIVDLSQADDDEESDSEVQISKASDAVTGNSEIINLTQSSVEFRVLGCPEVLARARVSRDGHMYNPSKKKQIIFQAQVRPFFVGGPFRGPVEVSIKFFFKRPLYHYGTGRNSNVIKADADMWHTKNKGDSITITLFIEF